MNRGAWIALCLLSGCGLFPDVGYLSACRDACGGAGASGAFAGSGGAFAGSGGTAAGAPAVGGASGLGGQAGRGGQAGLGGADGGGGAGGSALVGGQAGTGGAGGPGASGGSGSAGKAGSSAGGAAGAAAGQGGAEVGGAGLGGTSSGGAGNPGGGGNQAGGNQAGGNEAGGAATAGSGGATAAGNAGAAGASGGANACPSGRGPEMVRLPKNLGGGCVDSTEVTFAQYQAFLEDGSVDFDDQPNECALNKSLTAFVPTLYIQAAYKSDEAKFGSYAVSGVDWCDARAFCAWSGKKLCGKVGGGALTSADRNTAADQWWLACATQTQKSYPYGGLTIGGTKRPDTYDPSLCHTDDATQPEPLLRQRPVTTTCEGGVPGLYDLSGNLLEWTDSCAPGLAGQPQTDSCALRGGSFNFTGNAVLCTSIEGRERVKPEQKGTDDTNGLYYSAFGFRCCSE